MDMDFWQPHTLEADQLYRAQIGPLTLWCRKVGDEMLIGHQRGSENELPLLESVTKHTGDLWPLVEWTRWIVGKDTDVIHITPCLPNRAVVVRTESPVMIPSHREAIFFVSIPIWLKIQAGTRKKIDLCEIPSVIRSNIWFGDKTAGELCYSLVSRARREVGDADRALYRAVCPVKIRNRSDDMLPVERLCVHVAHLNIFGGARLLWTNDVTISFEGGDEVSKIDYGRHAPGLEADLKLLTQARTPLKETLIKRSLDSFVRLTDFG